jgi:Tol biopolymer transport system component
MIRRPLLRALPAVGLITAMAGFFLGSATPAGAALPGTNGLIAFERAAGDSDILTVDPSGGPTTNLTDNPAGANEDIDPAWSADGTKIAFASDRDGADFDIFAMSANGTNVTQVTGIGGNDPLNLSQVDPTWSPDGSQIAFEDGGTFGISRVSSIGGAITVVTAPDWVTTFNVDFNPAWSPQGNQIAVSRLDLAEIVPQYDIFRVSATDGSGATNVTQTVANEYAPDWSPDGNRLAFEKDGGGLGLINANGLGVVPSFTSGTDYSPAWSPDGSAVVFSRNGDLRTVDANGLNLTDVASTNNDWDPNWQPVNLPSVPGPAPVSGGGPFPVPVPIAGPAPAAVVAPAAASTFTHLHRHGGIVTGRVHHGVYHAKKHVHTHTHAL